MDIQLLDLIIISLIIINYLILNKMLQVIAVLLYFQDSLCINMNSFITLNYVNS